VSYPLLAAAEQAQYQAAARHAKWSLLRHPTRSMAATLRLLAQQAEAYDAPDNYGSGAIINEFEEDVAALLDMPAAVFLPSGTLAQPLALKIHCSKRNSDRIGLHPTSHLLLHEQQGYEALWRLQATTIGDATRVFSLADFEALKNQQNPLPAAIVMELPMREIGGQLPSWDDLVAQVAWARTHHIAVHFDGARLWQCPAYYDKSLAEIAALADSVYLSFYKDMGGIAGAMLLGDADFIAQARVWSRRAGGNLYALYPYILAARQGMAENINAIATAVQFTRSLGNGIQAEICRELDMHINPKPPQTAMFHLHLNIAPQKLVAAVSAYAEAHKILLLPVPRAVQDGYAVCELPIGRHAMQKPAEFWVHHLKQLLTPLLPPQT